MAIPKKEVKKFKIGGVEIVIGDRYVLDNKFDPHAPDGLQKIETTKYPFTGSGVNECINFDDNRGVYDTGFYKESLCLQEYPEEGKQELVTIYNKQIKEPFENLRNADLNPNQDNPFWNTYRYEAYANKEFDTTSPIELMELFQVIIQGIACDKNERNPFYRNGAQFVISSPASVKNKEKEKSKILLQAIQKLTTLADADKDKLDLVLEFIGRENTSKVDADDLKLIYFEVFKDKKAGLDLAENFIEACENYETPEGKEQMEFFYAINKLFKMRKIQKGKRGFETLDGTFLGNAIQDISKFCLNRDSAQYRMISNLIEENPQVRREIK